MFTSEQLKAAHGKVRSGADFPAYIKEIRSLGVTHYEAYVDDGHIDYHGMHAHTVTVPPKYAPIAVAGHTRRTEFEAALRAHQQGETDFATFLQHCATYGVEKWAISMDHMTCTYYNKAGDEILTEQIPQ